MPVDRGMGRDCFLPMLETNAIYFVLFFSSYDYVCHYLTVSDHL